jgi:hypothetical protein
MSLPLHKRKRRSEIIRHKQCEWELHTVFPAVIKAASAIIGRSQAPTVSKGHTQKLTTDHRPQHMASPCPAQLWGPDPSCTCLLPPTPATPRPPPTVAACCRAAAGGRPCPPLPPASSRHPPAACCPPPAGLGCFHSVRVRGRACGGSIKGKVQAAQQSTVSINSPTHVAASVPLRCCSLNLGTWCACTCP